MKSLTEESEFLAQIEETEFNRGGIRGAGVPGLAPFIEGRVPEEFKGFYTDEELAALTALKGTERDIEDRMKVKLTEYYLKLAQKSEALQNLVKARPEETLDLAGEADPSNQNRYSPLKGLLHKYEMILLYTAATCSAHCRYCYRLDLFSKKTGKELANIDEVVAYIRDHNQKVAQNKGKDPLSKAPVFPIREALLSGGDAMVLANKRIAKYLVGLADAGVTTIRIGTKELAFFPYRFDAKFFEMLDAFHTHYPQVRMVFAVHFTHPDEFLAKSEDNRYISDGPNYFKWMPVVETAVAELAKRHHYITVVNQTPIIYKVNDDSDALRILQKDLFRHGIGSHYFFQCREIEGHKTFAVPAETTWQIFTESQKGLSGIEKQARLVMSTEIGKMEIIGLTQDMIVFRVMRAPGNAATQGNMILAKRNPNALWLTGYLDRIIQDDTDILKTMTEVGA